MSEEIGRRVGNNEAVFREVNEAIERGRWPGEEKTAVAFRCECGQLGCDTMIELPLRTYERIRAKPTRFVVAIDHNNPQVETVVETQTNYLVVEKRGEAARVARESDPRG